VNLTPEDLAKLQTKNLANIIRKLNGGKTLTAREEAILAQAQVADSSSLATAGPAAGYARSWDELADACSIERRTLTNAREHHGAKCPKPRADGRHPIAEWIKFLDQVGVKGTGENNPEIAFTDERELRLRERALRIRREELMLSMELLAVARKPLQQITTLLNLCNQSHLW